MKNFGDKGKSTQPELTSIWGESVDPYDSLDADDGYDDVLPSIPHDPMKSSLRSGFPWERALEQGEGPVDTDKAHEGARTEFSGSLPATQDYLICLDGPCRHYEEMLSELDATGPKLLTQVTRICSGFGESTIMHEATCFACTRYSPPSTSLTGWRRYIISQHRLGVARRKLSGRSRLTLGEKVTEYLYSKVRRGAPELPVIED